MKKRRYHAPTTARATMNEDANVDAVVDFDDVNFPSQVSERDVERMFHVRQINRLVNIVDSLDMRTLRAIFNNATTGKIGELIDVYVQMEASDARLKGMLSSRRNAVSRTDAIVTSADDDNEQAKAARDLVLKNIEHLKWNEFRRSLMDARIYGVAMFENIWRRTSSGELIIDKIKQVDHTLIEQYTSGTAGLSFTETNNFGERFGEIVLRPDNLSPTRIFLDELPPYKLIKAYRTNRDGYHDLEGVMRSVARWYVLKTFLLRVYAQYCEVYGHPVPIAKVDQSDYKKNAGQIKKLLQSVGVNRYGIFFKSMEYELHEAKGTGATDVFDKYIALANTEVAIAILGQNLTSEAKGGSYAASQTHFQVLDDLTRDDLEYTDEVIQEQFVNPIVRVNYPSLAPELYPKYTSKLKRQIDLYNFAIGVRELSKSVEIPKKWIYENSQVPQPDEGEDVVFSAADPLLAQLSQT